MNVITPDRQERLLAELRKIINIPDPLPPKTRAITITIPADGVVIVKYECVAVEADILTMDTQ